MTLQTPTGGHTVELAIGGMTCSSCSARIEKKLNRMPGVEATVNFATEKAKVTFADDVTVDDLVATVEAATPRHHPPRRALRGRLPPGQRPVPRSLTPRPRRPATRGPSTPCASGSSGRRR